MDSYVETPTQTGRNSTEFERTLQGLLLMAIGTAFLWVPYLVYIGDLLNLIGIILIFLGRNAFQSSHGTYVIGSIVLYFLTFAILFVVALGFLQSALNILLGSASQSVKVTQLTSAFTTLFEMSIGIGFFSTLAFVLFPWKINDSTGHILLLVAYVAAIAISIFVGIVALGFVNTAFTNFINGASAQTVINQLNGKKTLYSLFDAVPYLIFAFAYYRTRSLISRPQPDVTTI